MHEIALDPPVCPYCGGISEWVKQSELPLSARDITSICLAHDELFVPQAEEGAYLCRPCGAFIHAFAGTQTPAGTLANETLRLLRRQVHCRFDPLWKGVVRHNPKARLSVLRDSGYWLMASLLHLPKQACCIESMSEETAYRVLYLLSERGAEIENSLLELSFSRKGGYLGRGYHDRRAFLPPAIPGRGKP